MCLSRLHPASLATGRIRNLLLYSSSLTKLRTFSIGTSPNRVPQDVHACIVRGMVHKYVYFSIRPSSSSSSLSLFQTVVIFGCTAVACVTNGGKLFVFVVYRKQCKFPSHNVAVKTTQHVVHFAYEQSSRFARMRIYLSYECINTDARSIRFSICLSILWLKYILCSIRSWAANPCASV